MKPFLEFFFNFYIIQYTSLVLKFVSNQNLIYIKNLWGEVIFKSLKLRKVI